jgi:hypothetical protein
VKYNCSHPEWARDVSLWCAAAPMISARSASGVRIQMRIRLLAGDSPALIISGSGKV